MSQKFRHSVRFKLMLAALTLLVIPWAGYRYLAETEIFLRDAQDQNLANTARALALLVQSRIELIPELTPASLDYPNPNLYVHKLSYTPAMDGYSSVWQPLIENFQEYTSKDGTRLRIGVAEYKHDLYLKLLVTDDQVRYQDTDHQNLIKGDSVQLGFTLPGNIMRNYLLLPNGPHELLARTLHKTNKGLIIGSQDNRIKANWKDTTDGYSVEIRIRAHLVGKQLGLQINNFDGNSITRLSTSDLDQPELLGTLVYPVPEITSLLQQAENTGERRRVLTKEGYVLGADGSLINPIESANSLPWILNKLTRLALRHQASDTGISADRTNAFEGDKIRIEVDPISSAIDNNPELIRYRPPGEDSLVLAASHPVLAYNEPIGAVLVEQSTEALLSIQNQALQRLLSITIILFLLVAMVLLGFASLLTARIRKLQRQVDDAVTQDGRIVGQIVPGKSKDEIGELGRDIAGVLGRLSDYNDYLEAMASRLTHELRTPLTIVRTSLDSCHQLGNEPALLPYLARAQQGTDRLESIIKRLREATRLEKILADVDIETVDLVALMQSMVTSFEAIYPNVDFTLSLSEVKNEVQGAPDLICQAIEKIIANAVDFHKIGTPIKIQLSQHMQHIKICVENSGSSLPENIDPFQSMVTVRKTTSTEPHLGLGLYLVRLIAEFHGGTVMAENNHENKNVRVCFSLSQAPARPCF